MTATNLSLRVDAELEQLVPRLSSDELRLLEADLLAHGCRDRVVLCDGVILDGHNRYGICTQHGLPFEVLEMPFDNKEDAKAWVIRNQFARRNLNDYQKSVLALKLENMIASRSRQGQRTDLCQNSDKSKPLDTKKELADMAGVSHDTIAKVKVIEAEANSQTKQQLIGGEISVNAAFTYVRRAKKEAYRDERREANKLLVKNAPDLAALNAKFATIVIDPPWNYADCGDVNAMGRSRPQYATMRIEEIATLPVGERADDDCHLYLWITNRSLRFGFDLIEGWDCRNVTMITWVKPSYGLGNYYRGQTEHVLFGVKGSQPLKRQDVGTVFNAPRGPKGHSSKPVEFYELVESCSPGPYLECFARGGRSGWTSWGAETPPLDTELADAGI